MTFKLILEKKLNELMNLLNELKILFKSFTNRRESRGRKMKRIFQWKRYLDWSDLTIEEKLSAKRFLLIPVFAYFMINIFNQNFTLIVLLLIIYLLYKKFEKGRIVKK